MEYKVEGLEYISHNKALWKPASFQDTADMKGEVDFYRLWIHSYILRQIAHGCLFYRAVGNVSYFLRISISAHIFANLRIMLLVLSTEV